MIDTPVPGEGVDVYIGLDPGGRVDPAGIAVNEPTGSGRQTVHQVRHVERLLGLTYPLLAERVRVLVERLHPDQTRTLRVLRPAQVTIAADATGAGVPFLDYLRDANLRARVIPITYSGGDQIHEQPGGGFTVPKMILMTTLHLALSENRLKLREGMKNGGVLQRELERFGHSLEKSGHVTYGAPGGSHDDLVSGVALSVWLAEKEGSRGGWPSNAGGVGGGKWDDLDKWY